MCLINAHYYIQRYHTSNTFTMGSQASKYEFGGTHSVYSIGDEKGIHTEHIPTWQQFSFSIPDLEAQIWDSN